MLWHLNRAARIVILSYFKEILRKFSQFYSVLYWICIRIGLVLCTGSVM